MVSKCKNNKNSLWCQAEFKCKGKSYEVTIDGDKDSDDEMILNIQGIPMHVEPEGFLYVEHIKNYTDEQLSFISYEIDKNIGWGEIKNYYLKLSVPVELINRHSHTKVSEHIIIEIEDNSDIGKRPSPNVSYQILSATSYTKTYTPYTIDMEQALLEMQEQLKDDYVLRVCACCKYGQGNPYGGDYWNYLCFRKNKAGYLNFPDGVNKEDWEFFQNKDNAEDIRPMFHCNQFESSCFKENDIQKEK